MSSDNVSTVVAKKLTADDELPMKGDLPTILYWVENYSWHAYDHVNSVGLFLHIGRWWADPTIWRQKMTIYTPGAQHLYQAFVRGDESTGPPSGLLSQVLVEPSATWDIKFSGPVQEADPQRLRHAPAEANFPVRAEFSLRFTATTAAAMFPTTTGTWGRYHYEQGGEVSGQITVGDTTFEVEQAFGYRDHSRGPRDLTGHLGHHWMQGALPGGEVFAVYKVWHEVDGEPSLVLDRGLLLTDTTVHDIGVDSELALPQSHDEVTKGFRLRFPGLEYGEIEGANIAVSQTSLHPPFDWVDGMLVERFDLFNVSQPALLTVGGQETSGWCERSYRHRG